MHNSTITKSLFLKDESSFFRLSKIAGVVHLVKSQDALDGVAHEIIEIARRAYLSRQRELCHRASELLLNVPASPGLLAVATYYRCLSQPTLPVDIDDLRNALLRAAGDAEKQYVPRMVLETGSTYDLRGELSEALRCYVEAGKAAAGGDPLVTAHAAENIALLRSDDGDHAGALNELERVWPLILSLSGAYTHLYYAHLNNLAVVLSRSGVQEESRRAIQVALASPLAPRFPEWHETAREIEEAAWKEPRRGSPTFRIPAAEVRRPAANQAPVRKTKDRQSILFIAVARRAKPAADARIVSKNRRITSLLERYVKTVRIRDRP